ncbi:MAG: DUF4307 domain-containing protein [Cellulomonas sp.]
MTESTTPHAPAGRYGTAQTPRRRRTLVVALATAGAVALALVVWIGIGVLQDPVQFKDVGYAVQGPDRIDVTFDVIKDPKVTVDCTVHALNQSFTEVGLVRVTIGPAATKIQRTTITVPTQELAVTGIVKSCQVAPGATR